jgi:hypothetical protein
VRDVAGAPLSVLFVRRHESRQSRGKRISASWSDRSQDLLVGLGGRRYGRRVNERGEPAPGSVNALSGGGGGKKQWCLSVCRYDAGLGRSVDGEVLLAHRPGI